MPTNIDESYECVDPVLGEQVWQYNTPEVTPELQSQLQGHLEICAKCRLKRALCERVGKALAEDVVTKPAFPALRWGQGSRLNRGLGIAASFNLAACLLLTFLLPPRDPDADRIQRAEGLQPRFVRPVTEEVLLPAKATFKWTIIENASSYVLSIRDTNSDFEWTTQTEQTSVQVPPETHLPPNTRLQAFLETVPPYLTPDTGIAVSFRTASWPAYAVYRAQANPLWVWILGLSGILLWGANGIRGLLNKRRS